MQNVLVAPGAVSPLRITPARIAIGAIRWPERVIAGFLIYAAAMALVLPVAAYVRNLVVFLNLAVILTYALILHFDSARRTLATGVIRDWLPLGLILVAYREMGWQFRE